MLNISDRWKELIKIIYIIAPPDTTEKSAYRDAFKSFDTYFMKNVVAAVVPHIKTIKSATKIVIRNHSFRTLVAAWGEAHIQSQMRIDRFVDNGFILNGIKWRLFKGICSPMSPSKTLFFRYLYKFLTISSWFYIQMSQIVGFFFFFEDILILQW